MNMTELGKVTVSEFVERFVPHNYIIYLYSIRRYKTDNVIKFDINTLWHGEDWRITDLQYLKDKNISQCEYSDYNVISTIRVPTEEHDPKSFVFEDEVDVIGLVIEFNDEVNYK